MKIALLPHRRNKTSPSCSIQFTAILKTLPLNITHRYVIPHTHDRTLQDVGSIKRYSEDVLRRPSRFAFFVWGWREEGTAGDTLHSGSTGLHHRNRNGSLEAWLALCDRISSLQWMQVHSEQNDSLNQQSQEASRKVQRVRILTHLTPQTRVVEGVDLLLTNRPDIYMWPVQCLCSPIKHTQTHTDTINDYKLKMRKENRFQKRSSQAPGHYMRGRVTS